MSHHSDEDLSDNDDANLYSMIIDKDEDYADIQKNYPDLFEFISKLRQRLKYQSKKISKLRKKLLNQKHLQEINNITKHFTDSATQTDTSTPNQWNTNVNDKSQSISEQVKQAAESALQQTGFVYEETSGLYYDYNSGYYYDAAQGLYYDGHTGIYYRYDEETRSYKFHSQTQLGTSAIETTNDRKKIKRENKRHRKISTKDDGEKSKSTLSSEVVKGPPEEGECSDSESSSSQEEFSPSLCSDDSGELLKTYPPCIRVIVKESDLPTLKIGTLLIIAYTGGSIGREGPYHAIIIPDINVSKQHARFQYDESKEQYEIVDLGSRNGTILNGKRLSVARHESQPHHVVHGSIVQISNTKLLCHIHSGNETCGHCEPGLIQTKSSNNENILSMKKQHHSELKRLKNKFGLERNNTKIARGYRDRAQARRQCIGSSNQYVKTQQSSVETSIAKDNKGFKLLSKMGWSEGQSLGKDGDGRTEPVPLVNNSSKTGLGACDWDFSEIDSDTGRKHALLKKTRQRYDEIE